MLKKFLIALSFMGLAACQTITEGPTTIKQNVAVANATLEGVNNTIRDLYCPEASGLSNADIVAGVVALPECKLGVISKDVARNMLAQSKAASKALNTATVVLGTGDVSTAENQLKAANQIILELQRQIDARKAK